MIDSLNRVLEERIEVKRNHERIELRKGSDPILVHELPESRSTKPLLGHSRSMDSTVFLTGVPLAIIEEK